MLRNYFVYWRAIICSEYTDVGELRERIAVYEPCHRHAIFMIFLINEMPSVNHYLNYGVPLLYHQRRRRFRCR